MSSGRWQRSRSGRGSAGTPARPTLSTPTSIPPRVVIVDKPGSPQTQLRVATIGAARSSPDFRPMQVMNVALGGNFRQPHQHEPARAARLHLRRLVTVHLPSRRGALPGRVRRADRRDRTVGVRNLQGTSRDGGRTAAPKTNCSGPRTRWRTRSPAPSRSSADAVGNFSNVFTYDLGLDYYTRYAEQVNAVTTDQTLAVSKKYLVPNSMVVVAVGDQGRSNPSSKALKLGGIEIRDAEGRPAK